MINIRYHAMYDLLFFGVIICDKVQAKLQKK